MLQLLHARSMQTEGYCLQDLSSEPTGGAQRKTKLKTSRYFAYPGEVGRAGALCYVCMQKDNGQSRMEVLK